MTAESSEDFHAHVEFYRKFVRHSASSFAVAWVAGLASIICTMRPMACASVVVIEL